LQVLSEAMGTLEQWVYGSRGVLAALKVELQGPSLI